MAVIQRGLRFKIYSPPHTYFAAGHLADQIRKLGHTAILVEKINTDDDYIYILYCAATLREFPRVYIVYQTEIKYSHWFNDRYLRIIRKAKAIWEYSKGNIDVYKHINNHVSIVTPGVSEQPKKVKTIPFLFYGYINGSQRRIKIIEQLRRTLPMKVVTNSFGGNMSDILRQTKVVINVHYYDHSQLEVFRLNEALSHGCHVVSEGSDDKYKGLVDFSPSYRLAESAQSVVNVDFKKDLKCLDNLEELRKAIGRL